MGVSSDTHNCVFPTAVEQTECDWTHPLIDESHNTAVGSANLQSQLHMACCISYGYTGKVTDE